MGRFILGLLLTVLVTVSPAHAQTFPKLTGRVVDQAHLLRAEQVVDLDSKLTALEVQSGRQLVVATVNSLEGREIADYAYRLGRAWEIGDKKRDDGVVFLVAPNERKVWITTGYGAGAYLTDSVTGRIVREAVLPRFKAGDMGGGIIAGVDRVIAVMKLPPEEAARQAQATAVQEKRRGNSGDAGFIPVIFIVIIFFMIIGAISRAAGGGRRYRGRSGGGISPWVVLWGLNELSRGSRGGWGGGGGGGFGGFGGGGGFSGGGGSFGGGGAGGSW